MAEGYDGRGLIDSLREHLDDDSDILELGMGPGKDLLLLGEHFTATGSDRSKVFLDRFRAAHPSADLLQLDAMTLETDRRFDAVYSNKVLQHLTPEELELSLQRQHALLRESGLVAHSLWYGKGPPQTHQGLLCTYFTEGDLLALLGDRFEVLALERYQEMEPADSLWLIARRRTDD
ncbi:MAG: class I SAM-dependent methyltransferase, partial [Acidobacteriota bacterium]